MKLFLCSHFSSVGSLIKEEIENKKVAFIPTASLREGYTGYVGSARKLFKKLGAIVTEIDISTEVHKSARVCHLHGLFPPFRRRFSATLSGLLATQTVFLNNERGTSKNAVTTLKEVHRNDGLQENSYASKYGVQPTRNGTQ